MFEKKEKAFCLPFALHLVAIVRCSATLFHPGIMIMSNNSDDTVIVTEIVRKVILMNVCICVFTFRFVLLM